MAPGGEGSASQGQPYLQPHAGSPSPLPWGAAPWPPRDSVPDGGSTLEGAAVMALCMGNLAGLLSSVEVKTLPPCIPSCCQQPGALAFLFWCHSLVARRGLPGIPASLGEARGCVQMLLCAQAVGLSISDNFQLQGFCSGLC